MEDKIIELLGYFLGHWGYYALFLTTFLEASALLGLFVPGESMVIVAGIVASKGIFDLEHVMWVSALGAVLGDTSGYYMGSRFGEKIFLKHGKYFFLKERRLEAAKGFFEAHGGKTVFLGRFISFLRTFAPVIAGMTKMFYPKFLLFNIAGGTVWAVVFSLLGFFLGNSWDAVRYYFSCAARLSALSVITGFTFWYVRYALKRRGITFRKALFLAGKVLSLQAPRAWGFVKSRLYL